VDGRVVRVNCKAGDVVQKDAVLFEIDPRPFEAELRRAEAGIGQADSRLKFYAVERKRALMLIQTGGVNQSELDRIEAERLNAEATLQSARAGVDLAKLNLEYTKVLAPMTGRVENPLAVGNVVRADRYSLGTLIADDPVVVAFSVDEKTTLRMLKAGGKAGAAAVGFADEDGFPHQGRIDHVGGEVDPKTGVVQWRLLLPNADRRILPGMFARVRLAAGQP
jgi:membrane fusion protein, multidrug efflux system